MGVWQGRSDEWAKRQAEWQTGSPSVQERALDVRKLTGILHTVNCQASEVFKSVIGAFNLINHSLVFVHVLFSWLIFSLLYPLLYPHLLSILHTKTPNINTLVKSDWCWIFQYGSAYLVAPMTCLDERERGRDSHDELWNGYYTESYISEELASGCTNTWIPDLLPLSFVWTDSITERFQPPFGNDYFPRFCSTNQIKN